MTRLRTAADALQARGLSAFASLALAASIVALGGVAPPAGATGGEPYSLQAEALFAPGATDLTLRVDGPTVPSVLEKVQVKAWPADGGGAETQNLFDVPSPGGIATIPLAGRDRGERLELQVHLDVRPQHNLLAETTVMRRPDLTVTRIDVPDDVVRTRAFSTVVTVAEVGGDVGAAASLELYDGSTLLTTHGVFVTPNGAITVELPVVLTAPGDHTLRAVVTGSTPDEWNVASNERERLLYVNRYDSNGVVATDHPLATQAGVDVLRTGGNAFDAAAAVQFVLNVTQPELAGLGGGSNVIVREGETGRVFAIDARETAPAAMTPTTYQGRTVAQAGPNGYAVGVPGTLRAIDYMLDRWGTRSLADSLQPAIGYAEHGFSVGSFLALSLTDSLQRARAYPETNAMFHRPDGTNLQEGDLLIQPDLARTFRLLAQDGPSAFYEGEIAQAIVAAQHRATTNGREGRMTPNDLAEYSIDVEEPLGIQYGGYDVLAPGPSTTGGVTMLESLGLIREFLANPENEGYAWGFGTRNSLHVFIEAMRLAFADRDMWIGDERFTNVPASLLLDREYLRDRSRLIGRESVMCSPVLPGRPFDYQGDAYGEESSGETGHTTHFSIIDRWGNVVVMTSTLADAFGSGIMVPGYGFLLNDSLTLFNLNPRANPATGNPGANDAAGGKRPMGSMAPTLVLKDGEPFLGSGTYSGAFIPSVVLNVVLNVLEYGMPLQPAVDAPRVWTAVANGDAAVNPGFQSLIVPLRAMGHRGPATGGCAGAVAANPTGGTAIGSTGSFAVNLSDFSLVGGEDSGRFPDATTLVVGRD
jgi:gamma-glutamyltranspeptidase / glutathione hydrolase